MTSQTAEGTKNDTPGISRFLFRRDRVQGSAGGPSEAEGSGIESSRMVRWARIERAWWIVLGVLMLVFSAFPIGNYFLDESTKDYGLWYQVGLAVRQGVDIYPRPETGRLFPFMYPPSAAAMLGFVSFCGPLGSLALLVLATSAAWFACVWLSVWLALGSGGRRHPLTVIVPSLSVIVLIYNIYLLGQPNLVLLALVLGAFACLRLRSQVGAGALVATAAAIKAFPILVLAYLVYRRMWKASATTVAVLVAWLLIAPLPFRSPDQAIDDLVVWSKGMIFTYNSYGIAQRPFRSYSYKNQSIMAIAHRLLRDVPADGESVLAQRARSGRGGPSATSGLPVVEPSTNLLAFLKPHARGQASRAHPAWETDRNRAGHSTNHARANLSAATIHPAFDGEGPRWDEIAQEAEAALRNAWRVNLFNLNFRTVTLITVFSILVICLFVAAVLPPAGGRTQETDALEFALVTLLTTMFSPLSFNYAYVWLLYPTTLALHRVLREPGGARGHRLKIAWISIVLLIPAFAIPLPQVAQAYGNLFVPALLLVAGLGVMLFAAGARLPEPCNQSATHSVSTKLATLRAVVFARSL
jgi:hypothetical protein